MYRQWGKRAEKKANIKPHLRLSVNGFAHAIFQLRETDIYSGFKLGLTHWLHSYDHELIIFYFL